MHTHAVSLHWRWQGGLGEGWCASVVLRFIETQKGCKGLVSKGCVRACVYLFSLILFALPGGGHSAANLGLKEIGFEFILPNNLVRKKKNPEVGSSVQHTWGPGSEGGGPPAPGRQPPY